jgi:hypothetical protein
MLLSFLYRTHVDEEDLASKSNSITMQDDGERDRTRGRFGLECPPARPPATCHSRPTHSQKTKNKTTALNGTKVLKLLLFSDFITTMADNGAVNNNNVFIYRGSDEVVPREATHVIVDPSVDTITGRAFPYWVCVILPYSSLISPRTFFRRNISN